MTPAHEDGLDRIAAALERLSESVGHFAEAATRAAEAAERYARGGNATACAHPYKKHHDVDGEYRVTCLDCSARLG